MSSTCLPSHQLLKASGPRKHPVQDFVKLYAPFFYTFSQKTQDPENQTLSRPVQAARTQSCVLRESCDKPLKMFASIK